MIIKTQSNNTFEQRQPAVQGGRYVAQILKRGK